MASTRSLAPATALVAIAMTLLCLLVASPVRADPMPGYDLDPIQMEQRMDDCLAGAVDDKFLIMGWIDMRSGDQRRWYCSSLKHMYIRAGDGTRHDPFVDIEGFMRCVDRTVSYGFPRPGDAGNTRLIYQYRGTDRRAYVIVNAETGDIASIYTDPPDDWSTCAGWAP